MILNNVALVERQNRPGVLDKVALVAYFINNGRYYDPYAISSVTAFKAEDNFFPSSLVTWENVLDYNLYLNEALMSWCNPSSITTTSGFDTSNFPGDLVAQQSEHNIYRISQGKYCVVLNGNVLGQLGYLNLSDTGPGFSTVGRTISNACSQTGDYIDIWTVQWTANDDLTTIVNSFTLNSDRMHVVTEPLMIKTSHRIAVNRVALGSKIKLKVNVEKSVENPNLDISVRNLFNGSLVDSPSMEIIKNNDVNMNLPARVTVSAFSDTSGLVDLTADDSILFVWDTSLLTSHPHLLDGTLGSITGTYYIRVKYTLLDEIIYSQPMYLTVL